MKLSDIIDGAKEIEIKGIAADSREVNQGFVFGSLNDDSYIEDAVKKGAVAIITRQDYEKDFAGVTMIKVENPTNTYAKAVAKYYGAQPSHIAAITGTNGKTSIADFTRQILTMMGKKAASIGTLGVIKGNGAAVPLPNTTPNNVTLHKILRELADEGFNEVILEASSHGLHQGRLDGVEFEVAGFTNLTRDHLDYHKTFENYFAAKMILFEKRLKVGGVAVLNADIDCFADIERICRLRDQKVISYGYNGEEIKLLKAEPKANGQVLYLNYFGKDVTVDIPLAGDFQASNVMCALGIVGALCGNKDEPLQYLSQIRGAKGRLDLIGEKNGAAVYVDYAHTPDALEQVLKALRKHTSGKLKVLFGCGGNRDKGKRPIMGQIADELADEVFVTDDNPRFEDADTIREEIMAACPKGVNIKDRAKAIKIAIDSLHQGDVLVLAGKGHESGQYVKGEILPFSDHEEAAKNLEN